jgi:hypothetical protein
MLAPLLVFYFFQEKFADLKAKGCNLLGKACWFCSVLE